MGYQRLGNGENTRQTSVSEARLWQGQCPKNDQKPESPKHETVLFVKINISQRAAKPKLLK